MSEPKEQQIGKNIHSLIIGNEKGNEYVLRLMLTLLRRRIDHWHQNFIFSIFSRFYGTFIYEISSMKVN